MHQCFLLLAVPSVNKRGVLFTQNTLSVNRGGSWQWKCKSGCDPMGLIHVNHRKMAVVNFFGQKFAHHTTLWPGSVTCKASQWLCVTPPNLGNAGRIMLLSVVPCHKPRFTVTYEWADFGLFKLELLQQDCSKGMLNFTKPSCNLGFTWYLNQLYDSGLYSRFLASSFVNHCTSKRNSIALKFISCVR